MYQAQFGVPEPMSWFRRGQRPVGTPDPTAAEDAIAKRRAVSMTTGARIRGQLNTGAVHMHDQQMLPLRFLLEGTAPNLYQLQMQMLCISLWMVVLETRHLGTAAVGSWNTLVTESLDAAEAINPDLPLPDTYYDAFMNVNSIDLARGLLRYLTHLRVDVEIVCQAAGGGDARIESMCRAIDPNNTSTYDHKVDCSRLNMECAVYGLIYLIYMDPPLSKFWRVPALQDLSLSGSA